jgi:hypothetical protein
MEGDTAARSAGTHCSRARRTAHGRAMGCAGQAQQGATGDECEVHPQMMREKRSRTRSARK